MYGFHAGAAKRPAQNFVNGGFVPGSKRGKGGGPVRGPGTGTSDSVETEVPEGSYIMPADSTQRIGERNLAAMGFDPSAPKPTAVQAPSVNLGFDPSVPVHLSKGEYRIPPEQVHAIGVQALNGMKGATHTPAQEASRDDLFFAEGGLVDDDPLKKIPAPSPAPAASGPLDTHITRDGDSFSGRPAPPAATPPAQPAPSAQPAAAPGRTDPSPLASPPSASPPDTHITRDGSSFSGKPAPTDGQAPTGPNAFQRMMPGTSAVFEGSGEDIKNAYNSGGFPVAAGQTVRSSLAYVPAVLDNVVGQPGRAAMSGVGGFGKTLFTGEASDTPTAPAPATTTTAAAQKSAAANPNPSAPAGGATAGSAPAAAVPRDNDVTRVGNSFSGKNITEGFTINGQAPTRGGWVETPPGAQQTPDLGQLFRQRMASGALPAGTGDEGPRVSVIGDLSARERERNAIMSAALTPHKGAQNGQLTLGQINAARSVIAGDQQSEAQRHQADNANRTQRDIAGMREANVAARAAAANDLQSRELELRQQAQMPQTRAAQRQEKLYEAYESAKTPDERSAIAQQIRDLSGKASENRYLSITGGQMIDPTTQQLVTQPGRIFDVHTRDYIDPPSSQPKSAQLAAGTTSTVNGKTAVWDGTKWVPR